MIDVKLKPRKKLNLSLKTKYSIAEFIIGAILTKTALFLNVLPIAISFSIASMIKTGKVYAMTGAFFGYLFLENSDYGFRYAGTLLVISAVYNLTQKNIYAIITCIIPIFSIIEIFSSNEKHKVLIIMVCELIICLAGTFLYSKFFEKEDKHQKIAILFFIATIISALSSVTIFFNISPIRICSVLLILVSTYFGKSGIGCIISVVLGIAMDSSLGVNSAIFTLAYSFSAVISGTITNVNKILFSTVFSIMFVVSAIFVYNDTVFYASVFEIITASIIFVVTPNKKFKYVKSFLKNEKITQNINTNKIFDVTSNASGILMQMSQVLEDNIESIGKLDYKDINNVYLLTTERVCKNCEMSQKCWNIEYTTSIDALNGATCKAINRGYFKSTDFPLHFSTRCVKYVDFLNSINEGIMSLNQNKVVNETLQTNKKAISNQCLAISAILKDITYSVSDPVDNFPRYEQDIQEQMQKYANDIETYVYNNSSEKFFIEIIGNNLFDIFKNSTGALKIVSKVVNKELEFMSQSIESGRTRIIFREKNKHKLEIAKKNISKHNKSGDILDVFENNSGHSYIVLSDGMGSGIIANRESEQVVSLLSKMLKSGISLPKSLKAVAPLVNLKNNDKNFVALDILTVNLTNLQGTLAKYGAAATYILRNNKVHKISSTNLPLGLCTKADMSRIRLENNDLILMASDGILSQEDDEYIVNTLKTSQDKSCEQICEQIISVSQEDDDKTIVVIRICLNN